MSKMEACPNIPTAAEAANLWSSSLESFPAGAEAGGASRDRTDDLKLAKLALSQLSYGPMPHWTRGSAMVGRGGVEPTTSRLSGVRSNHLSYRPPFATAGHKAAGGVSQLRRTPPLPRRGSDLQDEGT